VLVEEEFAQPWSVGRWARPYPVKRRFEPLTGAKRHEPMVCGGIVQFPMVQGVVELVLITSEDREVDVLVGSGLAAQPEVQRPPPSDPPRGCEATHDLQQAGGIELLPLPQVRVVEPDHLSIL
jgi:hypothetical protein